jgi:hypothetical protein
LWVYRSVIDPSLGLGVGYPGIQPRRVLHPTRFDLKSRNDSANPAAGTPLIPIAGKAGIPPEIYRLTYNLRGLCVSGSAYPFAGSELDARRSQARPSMPGADAGFPSQLDDSIVSIGDFWAASEGLDDSIIRIGRMITYREYNTKSPLNRLSEVRHRTPTLCPLTQGSLHHYFETQRIPLPHNPKRFPQPSKCRPLQCSPPTFIPTTHGPRRL